MPHDRLAVLDAAFVQLERPTQPMHVGFLAIAEGGPLFDASGHFRLEEVRRTIAARLHRLPRFRQRLQRVPFGRPVWLDDESFDISHHVGLVALPAPGREQQLVELMGRLQAVPLDRRQALWELWFVEGLEGGRVAIIQKTHHALADGISGVAVANVMFDRSATPAVWDAPAWTPAPTPSRALLLTASLGEEASRPMRWARHVGGALSGPGRAAEQVGLLARTARAWTRAAPATPLNVSIGSTRRFEVVRTDLAVLRAIKRAYGGTTNDVVLAAVTGGLRHLMASRGEVPDGLRFNAMVPVSVRTHDHRGALGNRLSALLADLPVGEPDPVARLRAVTAHMDAHKEARGWVGVEMALAAAEHLPSPVATGLARLFPRLRPANLLVANVPGPRAALHCLGARIDEVFPYVGPVAGMALMISTLRYDGRLSFGLCADGDSLPNLAVLADGIDKDLTALARTAAARTRTQGERPHANRPISAGRAQRA